MILSLFLIVSFAEKEKIAAKQSSVALILLLLAFLILHLLGFIPYVFQYSLVLLALTGMLILIIPFPNHKIEILKL